MTAMDRLRAFMAAANSSARSPFSSAHLQALDVKCCLFISAAELQQLLLVRQPRELLAPRWAEPPHLRALSAASATLTSLDLGDATTDVISLVDGALASLPTLPALRSLSLRRCTAITDAGVAHLGSGKLPSLTHLDVTSTRVAGASGFASLAGGRLQSLVLLRCRGFGATGLRFLCEQHARVLRSLVLCGSGVPATGVALWCLQPAAWLQRLDLGPSWEVDGEGLAALACCPDLRELRLGNFHLVPARRHGANNGDGGEDPGMALPAAAAVAIANAVAAFGAAAIWQPADQLAAATAAAAAEEERQPWMPTPAARPLERLRVLRLGGMFAQHGLHLILPRLRRLVTLELSGLSTARDSVLTELVKAAEAGARAGTKERQGAALAHGQAQAQGQAQGQAQAQGRLPSRQGSVDSSGSGSLAGSDASSGGGRGEEEDDEMEVEEETAAGPRAGGGMRLQELRLVSGGPDLTAAGLLQLAALPRLTRLALVACPCATEPAVQQLVAAVRGRRDGGGGAAGSGEAGGGASGGGGVRQPRRRRPLLLEVMARANSSPAGSVGGAGVAGGAGGAGGGQAEAPAPQVYNI